jgi:hypothetical protein
MDEITAEIERENSAALQGDETNDNLLISVSDNTAACDKQ